MIDVFMHNVYGMESNISLGGLAFSLTLSFILGAALANIYYHIDHEVSKGFTTTLALFPPCICVIMLLFSYNKEPKNKMISMVLPAVAIVLCIFIVLEATRMGVGMIMNGKQINVDEVGQMLKSLVGE